MIIAIDVNTVRGKLSSIQSHKVARPDNVFLRVMKETAAVINIPLTIIFKKSLGKGKLLAGNHNTRKETKHYLVIIVSEPNIRCLQSLQAHYL